MEVRVQLKMRVPVKITKRKKWVIASCPILDVHTQGPSEKKAKENLGEALSLFFISCYERGTLDAVLKNCGFRAVQLHEPHPDKTLVDKEDYINIQIPFMVNNTGETCHALPH